MRPTLIEEVLVLQSPPAFCMSRTTGSGLHRIHQIGLLRIQLAWTVPNHLRGKGVLLYTVQGMHGAEGCRSVLLRTCCEVFALPRFKPRALCRLCAGTHLCPPIRDAILCCWCGSVLLIGC